MAEIKFKNKRTGNVCRIFHIHYFDLMENNIKIIIKYATKFPLETESGTFNNVDEILGFLDNFRFRGFKVRDHKEQSFDGVMHNTLIGASQKNAIFPYIYNELQRDIGIIMKNSDFGFIYGEIESYFKEKDDTESLLEWQSFYSELLEDDTIYAYLEDNIFFVESDEVKISKLLEQENFFEKLKETLNDYSDYQICDLSEILAENMLPDSDFLTEEEEYEIAEEKMELLEQEVLDKYFFENNYNALSVLNSLKK